MKTKRTLIELVKLTVGLVVMATVAYGQTSDGTVPLAAKLVPSNVNSNCSMTCIGSEFINDRSSTCAQSQTHFANGEVRFVDYGFGIYGSNTPYSAVELTSCACSLNGQWVRTMGNISGSGSASIKWTWKFFGREPNCGLTLKRDLVVYGCSMPSGTCSGGCNEGFHCVTRTCTPITPVLIDLNGNGVRLTNRANGVRFDLDSNDEKQMMPWLADAEDGWLVLNDKEDGFIVDGRQFFGDLSAQGPEKWSGEGENGYRALRGFDDNKDDVISSLDGIWRLLGIWRDANHNGLSEGGEVASLSAAGIAAISLDYHESRKKDRHGNEFRYRSEVTLANGKKTFSWDVFLTARE